MIHVGIIGTGAISSSHIAAYQRMFPRCKIIGLCDIYIEKARQKAAEYDLNDVLITDDAGQLLESDKLDLVSVCTPPYTHAELTVQALQSGKHVLVEKPMASSLAECDQMIAAAEENKKLLSVIAQNRFKDPIWKLKQVIDQNLIGDILHVQVDSLWWRGYSYYDLWWRGTWEKEGGGCTLNHAVHHIDALQWIMGAPLELQAVMSNVAHDNAEVEDISIANLRFSGGTLATVPSRIFSSAC
jgi:UDP-N-acetyl-2-amino-2-deoxyglucuronate dehydrogenase